MPVVATHVLISRPAPEAVELAQRVTALGLEPVLIPAFEFRPLRTRIGADVDWNAAAHRLVVFSSPRAVTFGLPLLDEGLLRQATVAAIGPATRDALEAAGLQVDLAPAGRSDSEGLLATLERSQPGGAALILAAPGGRKALRDGLTARGWRVREAFVYERVAVAPEPEAMAALVAAGGVISLWTSAQAMHQLLDKLVPAARHPVLEGEWLVASERLRELARQFGAARVRLCEGAGNDALVRALAQAVAGSGG